jgi:hypothetical protein
MRYTHFLAILPILALGACGSDTKTTTIKGDNGETVTVQSEGDGDGTTRIDATGENGEKFTGSIGGEGARWPADAPAFAPAYPGATLTSVMNSESNGTRGSMISFETSDPVAKVVAHYKALAKANGLGEFSTMDSGAASIFTAKDKENGGEFFVQATTVEGKTQGSITFSTKTPA